MSKDELSLYTIIESIDTILLYSRSSQNADDFYHDRKSFDAEEIWDIIENHLPVLKTNIQSLL
ncbi:hypothetical protein [Sulfurovum sp.]|uniref:hypothetical protein n=1 Tax=Sulfurovum sp. TaxID=1969726 RepID=UPI0025F61386|nr:hypothetical protein [Sulfurovum sp.]